MKGYIGKILHVDLTNEKFEVEQPDELFYREYLGGSGFGGYYLMKETQKGIDALSPENVIIFGVGPFTGAALSGASRHSVTTKSPLTGGIVSSEAGGYFAPELKFSGFDALVIKGKAKKPVYLWVHDGEYELKNAKNVWGKVTGDAQDAIREELGDSRVRVAGIGPGGENLVKYACISNELAHFNGRGGAGAVMGSKNLKAVAVRGKQKPEFADPEKFKACAKHAASEVKNNPAYAGFKEHGTNVNVVSNIEAGGLPTKNWQSGYFEDGEKLLSEAWNEELISPGTCWACAQSCKRHIDSNKTKELDPKYGGPEYETVGMCGSNLMISDKVGISKINEVCSKYTMDTISFGGSVGFAMECFEKGIITLEDTGGIDLSFGNVDSVIKLAEMTGKREGFGDVVARGTREMAELWGEEAKKCAVHVKGREFPAHMTCNKASLGLAYALVPIGADHVSSDFDGAVGVVPIGYQHMGMGDHKVMDPGELNDDKALYYWNTQKVYSLLDILPVCILCFGYWTIFDFDDLVDLINAATGWKMTLVEALKAAERRIHLQRAFNAREGITKDDDVLPKRIFEALSGGPSDGFVYDRDAFNSAKDYYYQLAGWDSGDGYPRDFKLKEFGIEWAKA